MAAVDLAPRFYPVLSSLRLVDLPGWAVVAAEYVETESGKRSDRPKLAAALSHAKAIGAKLVFAKLDRLTRKVDLLRSLVATVERTACSAATLVS
ncbi:hypothetical protein CQ14_41255 [Bradyrhizobium lablabi]|uniref:Resolvase/invertase-type recombinase catalytic domain-containing protein n=1 Tax=Bradyrhizobium lablabi TaxID=722472 RepID=A0A0R3N7P3_9BRAD|nr:hypothetical protein CQ14_41255 [Bradyrhizobium lablabi]